MTDGTPRVLRVSFEFHVDRELKKNIQWGRIERALEAITQRVIGMAETVFPWAWKVTVRKQWVYNWHDDTEIHILPSTSDNTSA